MARDQAAVAGVSRLGTARRRAVAAGVSNSGRWRSA
jgi:hypothetical protein